MSRDYLSQEEIDALLKQTDDPAVPEIGEFLSPIEQDALGEIGNITFGSAATALSSLLSRKVEITTPTVSLIAREELTQEFPQPHVAVHVTYVDGFEGINSLVMRMQDVKIIANLMMGGDGNVSEDQEISEIEISAVQEAMNQMMGSSATSMSTIFNRFVNISPPGIDILDVSQNQGINQLPEEDQMIKISFRLIVAELIDSNIMQLLPVSFAKEMVNSLMNTAASEPEPVSVPEPVKAPSAHVREEAPVQEPVSSHRSESYQTTPAAREQVFANPRNVQNVQFSNLNPQAGARVDETNLDLLLDIPLKVTVELGRTQKQVKDILELSQGSIIELDKLAGEPVDILVNNKLVAKGEVVVIDENFGVRVTDVISQWDRIHKIQQ